MAIAKTVSIALSTVGMSGTGTIVTFEAMKPKNIRDQLIWEELEVLDPEKNDEAWTKIAGTSPTNDNILKEFVGRHKEPKNVSEVNIEALKEACKKVLPKKNEGKDLEYARKYCVKKKEN